MSGHRVSQGSDQGIGEIQSDGLGLELDVRTLKDATGKVIGPDLYAAAQKPKGQITEVSYMWPRAGSDTKGICGTA